MSQYKTKFIVSILLVSITGGYVFFRNIGTWLDQSTAPVYSDIIVCLSYNPARVNQAVSLLKEGYGEKIFATTKATYSRLLNEHITHEQIVISPSSGTSTYEEGLLLKTYLQKNLYQRILVVSDPYHLYRVRWTFSYLFKNTSHHFSYVSSVPRESLGFWWNNHNSRRAVLRELPSIVYYWVGHGLLGIQENPAWLGAVKLQYLTLLERTI